MRTILCFVVFGLVLSLGSSAAGQTAPANRPYRGLFGTVAAGTEQLLTVGMSLGGGYDTNVLAGSSATSSSSGVTPRRTRSQFGSAVTSVTYRLDRSAVGLTANIDGGANYFSKLQKPLTLRTSGTTSGRVEVRPGTNLIAKASVSLQPLYLLTAPTAVNTISPQSGPSLFPSSYSGAQIEDYVASSGMVGATQQISSHFMVGGEFRRERSHSPSSTIDLYTRSVGGYGRVLIAKGLGLRLGVLQTDGRYGIAQQSARVRSLDAGLDFAHAFSLTRSTTFSFGTGSTAFVDNQRTRYYLTGNAQLNREIGQTWWASLVYSRSVDFEPAFLQPVSSDRLGINLTGLAGRRFQFLSSLGTSRGVVGFGQPASAFTNYYGTVAIRMAVSRVLSIDLDGAYLRYRLGAGVVPPLGLSNRIDRQTARIMVSLWAPVVETRSSHASR